MKKQSAGFVLLGLFCVAFSIRSNAQIFELFPQIKDVYEDETIMIDPFVLVSNETGFLDYSISGVTDVEDGEASFGGAPPMVTYTPNLNFNGIENIFVTGCVNSGTICDEVEIIINVIPVADVPMAGDDSAETYHVTPVTLNILENDIDIDGDGLDVEIIDDGAHGTAVYLGDSLLQYTPEFGWVGEDFVTYRACNAGSDVYCDIAQVTITINTNNFNAPVANPDFVNGLTETVLTVHPIENDFDGDADNLILTELIMDGAFGNAVMTGSNDFDYVSEISGTDSFLYVVCDLNTPQFCDTTYVKVNVSDMPVVIPDIYVPDSFSPNHDGTNDDLEIAGLEAYASFHLRIYNRWNDIVYETDDAAEMWDGSANTGIMSVGKEVPEGTYFYILELQGKADPLRGFIVLKR